MEVLISVAEGKLTDVKFNFVQFFCIDEGRADCISAKRDIPMGLMIRIRENTSLSERLKSWKVRLRIRNQNQGKHDLGKIAKKKCFLQQKTILCKKF